MNSYFLNQSINFSTILRDELKINQNSTQTSSLYVMVKKIPSKADLREELNAQLDTFLNKGKNIAQIPRGVSSRDGATEPLKADNWQMDSKKTEWTFLPEVVDTLEKRRQEKPNTLAKKSRPKRKLIYDDFGEPLRWVWVDD